MTGVLDVPVRVDRHGERIYFFDGRVSVDMNGSEAERMVVLEFLAQSQAMASLLVSDLERWADVEDDEKVPPEVADKRKVLREAGLL